MIYTISRLMSHFAVVDIHVKLFHIMWYVQGSEGTVKCSVSHNFFSTMLLKSQAFGRPAHMLCKSYLQGAVNRKNCGVKEIKVM